MLSDIDVFVLDQYYRSFELKDSIYSKKISVELEADLLNEINPSEITLLKFLYDNIKKSILSNVKIVDIEGCKVITKIAYDSKFGWVISSGSEQAYLGKIDEVQSRIEIGAHSYFSSRAFIRGIGFVGIGKYVSIANNVSIITSNISHPTQFASTYNLGGNARIVSEGRFLDESFYDKSIFKEESFFKDDVWIGENVTIFNGVNLGYGSVIASNAVVTKDTEPYGIYGGVPAKLIKYRFPEKIIRQLLELKWWNWSHEKVLKNKIFFLTDFNNYTGLLSDLVEEL